MSDRPTTPSGDSGPPTAPVPPHWPGPQGSASTTGRRGLWSEATSTGGGRAALVAAAVLGTLLLVTGLGLVAALAGDVDDLFDRSERDATSEDRRPGLGLGRGQSDDDEREGRGNGRGNGLGADGRPGMGPGMGPGGLAAAGDLMHGEFTTGVTGTPTVMVVQSGEVTAHTPGRSLTVESGDGFEATYSLVDSFATTGTGAPLDTGAQVFVVAAKEGLKVTRLVVLG